MARLRVLIETDGAAFDGPALFTELARILRDTAGRIEREADLEEGLQQTADGVVRLHRSAWGGRLLDVNGNDVGRYRWLK